VALQFYDSIDARLQLLAVNPNIGELRPDLARNVRAFSIGNYVLFFRPLDDGVELLRVLHSARDIPRIFRSGK
jgi:toxin ParE1/3/4